MGLALAFALLAVGCSGDDSGGDEPATAPGAKVIRPERSGDGGAGGGEGVAGEWSSVALVLNTTTISGVPIKDQSVTLRWELSRGPNFHVRSGSDYGTPSDDID